jgi:hypothetical protein
MLPTKEQNKYFITNSFRMVDDEFVPTIIKYFLHSYKIKKNIKKSFVK